MSEQKRNGKKIAIIVASVLIILALIAAALVLVLRNNGGDTGPKDENGDPLYPKTSDVSTIEYLHRPGLQAKGNLVIDEKELTDKEAIGTFLDTLKTIPLTDPTEKDRANIDYTGDVEMFTLKLEDGNDDTLLIMGDSISINNEYGNYFYMTEGLDLKSLTKDFVKMDIAGKLASADDADASTEQ